LAVLGGGEAAREFGDGAGFILGAVLGHDVDVGRAAQLRGDELDEAVGAGRCCWGGRCGDGVHL